MICPGRVTCLSVDCCFSGLALYKYNFSLVGLGLWCLTTYSTIFQWRSVLLLEETRVP
jgi:hypothetical protein